MWKKTATESLFSSDKLGRKSEYFIQAAVQFISAGSSFGRIREFTDLVDELYLDGVKLLKHIRQNNEVGTPFKELQQVLPGLNRNQIQVLMQELKEDGKVVCKGKTSAARWFIIK